MGSQYLRLNWTWRIKILREGVPVCQTLCSNVHLSATQPATNTRTDTPLCKPFFAHLSEKQVKEYQRFQWIHRSPNTLQIRRHRDTRTSITREWRLFIIFCNVFIVLLLRSNLNKNTFFFFFCTVLYIPGKVYNLDLQQTGSSFKNVLKSLQVIPTLQLLVVLVSGLDSEPILPRTGKGLPETNVRTVDTAARLQ